MAHAVSAGVPDHVRELLAQSLQTWRVVGDVGREADGSLVLTAGDKRLHIARGVDANLPFRWMVTEGERTRGVGSIAGLLRTVRTAVDRSYRPIRLRIAPMPLVPP